MTTNPEQRAREVLTSLADEVADDGRVCSIIAAAIQKLMDRPCKPHWWCTPEPGDKTLVCDVCRHRLAFATMSGDILASIVNGYERRNGPIPAKEFRKALYRIIDRDRPPERVSVTSNFRWSSSAASRDPESRRRRFGTATKEKQPVAPDGPLDTGPAARWPESGEQRKPPTRTVSAPQVIATSGGTCTVAVPQTIATSGGTRTVRVPVERERE